MPSLFDPGFIKMLKRPAPIEDTFGLRDKPVFRNNDPPPSLWTRLKNDVKSFFNPKEDDPEEIHLTDTEDGANYLDDELEKQGKPNQAEPNQAEPGVSLDELKALSAPHLAAAGGLFGSPASDVKDPPNPGSADQGQDTVQQEDIPGSVASLKPRNELSGRHTPPTQEEMEENARFNDRRQLVGKTLKEFQDAMALPDQRADKNGQDTKQNADSIDVYRDKNGSLLFGAPDQMASMAEEQGLTKIGSRSEWEAQNRADAEAREKARGDHYTTKYKTVDDFVTGEKNKLLAEQKQLQGQMSGSRKSIQDLIDEEVGRMGGPIQPYGGGYDMARGGERVTQYGRGHGGKGARVVGGDDLYERNKARMLNEGQREKAYERLRNRGAISEWFNQDAAFAKNRDRLNYINSRLNNWTDSEKMLRNNWASWTKNSNGSSNSPSGQSQSDSSIGANIPDYLKADKTNNSPAPDPTVDTLKSISSPLASKAILSDKDLFGQAVKDVNDINGVADYRSQSTLGNILPSDRDLFFGAAKDVAAKDRTNPAMQSPISRYYEKNARVANPAQAVDDEEKKRKAAMNRARGSMAMIR